jgi:hypothetical protein
MEIALPSAYLVASLIKNKEIEDAFRLYRLPFSATKLPPYASMRYANLWKPFIRQDGDELVSVIMTRVASLIDNNFIAKNSPNATLIDSRLVIGLCFLGHASEIQQGFLSALDFWGDDFPITITQLKISQDNLQPKHLINTLNYKGYRATEELLNHGQPKTLENSLTQLLQYFPENVVRILKLTDAANALRIIFAISDPAPAAFNVHEWGDLQQTHEEYNADKSFHFYIILALFGAATILALLEVGNYLVQGNHTFEQISLRAACCISILYFWIAYYFELLDMGRWREDFLGYLSLSWIVIIGGILYYLFKYTIHTTKIIINNVGAINYFSKYTWYAKTMHILTVKTDWGALLTFMLSSLAGPGIVVYGTLFILKFVSPIVTILLWLLFIVIIVLLYLKGSRLERASRNPAHRLLGQWLS